MLTSGNREDGYQQQPSQHHVPVQQDVVHSDTHMQQQQQHPSVPSIQQATPRYKVVQFALGISDHAKQADTAHTTSNAPDVHHSSMPKRARHEYTHPSQQTGSDPVEQAKRLESDLPANSNSSSDAPVVPLTDTRSHNFVYPPPPQVDINQAPVVNQQQTTSAAAVVEGQQQGGETTTQDRRLDAAAGCDVGSNAVAVQHTSTSMCNTPPNNSVVHNGRRSKAHIPDAHRIDRMLVQPEFYRLQQLTSRQFTVDCFSRTDGTNSHCQHFFSPDQSFFEQDLVDHHCWINMPFNMINETLQHYKQCKDKHPDRISAVFCVPKPSSSNPPEWSHLLKGMQLLAVYGRGTRLFTGPNPDDETQRHLLPGIKHEIAIYYDPVRSSVTEPRMIAALNNNNSALTIRTRHIMQVPITLAGIPAVALLDTGAEESDISLDGVYISHAFAVRHNLQIKPLQNATGLTAADGQSIQVQGTARVTLKIGRMVNQVHAAVLDMDDKIDVILGEAWLVKHKALIDYQTNACVFARRGKRYIIKCIRRPKKQTTDPAQAKAPKLLTLMQARRVMRKKVWYCLALVRKVQGSDPSATDSVTVEITDPRVKALVDKYPTVFTDDAPVGGSQIQAEHECIPLVENAKPTYRPMFRYSPLEMAEMERQIKALIEKGYIEPSTSPYGSPVLFVKKPRSEELRLVIDYRMLNRLTVKNKYPLPRIDDMLDALSGAKVFSSLDLRQAYHQIKLQDSDKPKTAFRTPFGHYQWATLSMGLTNAPAVFQAVVNNIFRPYLGKFVVVYLDDICVYSKSEEEHMKHLSLVLDKLEEFKLTAAWHKCHFFQEQLLFVGHVVSEKGVQADPAKVSAISDYPQPTDLHELRSFLGMCNYFRRYIHKYANIVAPLTQLLKKDSEYIWTDSQQQAFETIKQALITAPVLKLPDWQSDQPFDIVCDASYSGIAGMLMQDNHPIAYESRKLNSAELNYSPTELEMLGVVHCIKQWRCYIEGKDVHVHTDHKPNTTFTMVCTLLTLLAALCLDMSCLATIPAFLVLAESGQC